MLPVWTSKRINHLEADNCPPRLEELQQGTQLTFRNCQTVMTSFRIAPGQHTRLGKVPSAQCTAAMLPTAQAGKKNGFVTVFQEGSARFKAWSTRWRRWTKAISAKRPAENSPEFSNATLHCCSQLSLAISRPTLFSESLQSGKSFQRQGL